MTMNDASATGLQDALFELERAPARPRFRPWSWPLDDDDQGGAFEYHRMPDVLLGRQGIGPLRVAWDSDVLIDYCDFGAAIWDDDLDFAPNIEEPRYLENLLALCQIMHTWFMRDIRLHVFERQFWDCRHPRDAALTVLRQRQIEQIRSALACLDHGTERQLDLDAVGGACRLTSLKATADRDLLELAIDDGCHVFLTRDRRFTTKAAAPARAYGVSVMSPLRLLGALHRADELGPASAGAFPVPDGHKWQHVVGACT